MFPRFEFDAGGIISYAPPDCSVCKLRDLKQVASKLKVVLLPREDQEGILKQLKEWDLWGPLMVCLTLSIMLSITAPEDQKALVFAGVFVIVWIGAAVVTLNAQLLGGKISFFQSVCILGYCVFPLNVACFVCLFFKALFTYTLFIKLIVVGVGFVWSTRGTDRSMVPAVALHSLLRLSVSSRGSSAFLRALLEKYPCSIRRIHEANHCAGAEIPRRLSRFLFLHLYQLDGAHIVSMADIL